jgi:hypothetical protein
MGAAMVLGENIGTTITANIAAAVGNANARRAAMAHTLFNLFGVCWALVLFRPFLMLVGTTITWLGLPNPMDIDYSATIAMTEDESMATLYGVSMLHTLFNLFNTCILIWFVPVIVKMVMAIIKDKKGVNAEDESVKLKFIDAGPLSTAELAIGQARNEVIHFAEISRRGVDFIRQAINAPTPKEFEENMHLMDLFAYDDCPLISVPSWRKKWAERHRDKCVANTPPRVESIYLWHKKNYKAKHLFCEGKLSKVLHKKTQLPYSWCGNACFANIYVMPELTASYEDTKILSAGRVDVYSAAVYLNLLADGDKLKLKFQNFHSCLNWLNIAAKRLYCKSCNHILAERAANGFSALGVRN